jgi:hypothetical protein
MDVFGKVFEGFHGEQHVLSLLDGAHVEHEPFGKVVSAACLVSRFLAYHVGEMDDNVDPSSTYQVCNALIKAKKDFELVVLPGIGHTMGEEYGEHKRYDFFVKNIMGVTPPAWNSLETKK